MRMNKRLIADYLGGLLTSKYTEFVISNSKPKSYRPLNIG
jgi:hypothetical protein